MNREVRKIPEKKDKIPSGPRLKRPKVSAKATKEFYKRSIKLLPKRKPSLDHQRKVVTQVRKALDPKKRMAMLKKTLTDRLTKLKKQFFILALERINSLQKSKHKLEQKLKLAKSTEEKDKLKKEIKKYDLQIKQIIFDNKLKKLKQIRSSGHYIQKKEQTGFETHKQSYIFSLKELTSLRIKLIKLNERLDQLHDFEESDKMRDKIDKLNQKLTKTNDDKERESISIQLKNLKEKFREYRGITGEIEKLEEQMDKLRENMRNTPGLIFSKEVDPNGAQVMSAFQVLNGHLKLGTILHLYPSKLADGIMQTQYSGHQMEHLVGGQFDYDVKGYGQLLNVRAGINQNGTRLVRIQTNIIPKGFGYTHATVEFSYGYTSKYQVEPGVQLSNVKSYGLNLVLKIPNLFGQGKVSMLRGGFSDTKGKTGPLQVKRKEYNLGFGVPIGNKVNLDFFGNVTAEKRPGDADKKLSFNVGAALVWELN